MQKSSREGPARATPPNPAQYAGTGATFAAAVILFTLGGNWVDGRLGTGPWGVLIGVAAGFTLGLLWMYHHLVAPQRPGAGEEQ
jgi:F0F1-type ATP synthase assembly protein I